MTVDIRADSRRSFRPRALPARALLSLMQGGAVYLVLFLAVHITLAATTTGFDGVAVIELALIGLPAAAVSLSWRTRDLRVTIGCAVLLSAAALFGTWNLPRTGDLGYTAWHFGAITFVLLGMTVTRRVVAAWMTYAVMAVFAVVWAVQVGRGVGMGIGMIDRHAATLIVGTLFSVGLARSNRSQARYAALQEQQRAADRAVEARATARRAAVGAVLEEAGPMLAAIAEGRELDEAERRELLVLEGSLRDRIRTPGPLLDGMRDHISAARRRGVSVLLLDETPDAGTAETRADAARWLAGQLDGVATGSFVGRVRPSGDGVRVTAVTDSERRSETFAPERQESTP
jgi:hypothetical protein